mgnify:CR=1 FL=1
MGSSDIIAIISVALSAVAAGFSLWSFFLERNRNRSESTIHAFDALQEKAFGRDEVSINSISADKAKLIVHNYITYTHDETYKKQWRDLTKNLALLEHFAVGVNLKTYDLKTLNAMAGNMMIEMWNSLTPIIEYKRSKQNGKKNYYEFQKMVEDIIQYRRRKGEGC